MGIRQEINSTMKNLCKIAQDYVFVMPTGNDQIDAYSQLANVHLMRGVARGAKEAIPGLMDGVVGNLSGVVDGTIRGANNLFSMSNETFSDGFRTGFDAQREAVKRDYSDPLRRLAMSVGGNGVKRLLSGAQKYHEGTIENGIGKRIGPNGRMTSDWYEYERAKNSMRSIEGGMAAGTELAISLLGYGKLIGSILSRAPAVARTAGGMSKENTWNRLVAPWLDAASSVAYGMKTQADIDYAGRELIDNEARRLNAESMERRRLFESDRPGPFRR